LAGNHGTEVDFASAKADAATASDPRGFPVAYQHAFNTANRVDGAAPLMPTRLLAAAPMTPATAMPKVTITNKKQ
jgi:hypothetical protein